MTAVGAGGWGLAVPVVSGFSRTVVLVVPGFSRTVVVPASAGPSDP